MTWREAAEEAARTAYPREACGLLVVSRGRLSFRACRNIAEGEDHFVIHPDDWADAEDSGEVVAVVHSHPDESPEPSDADRVGCERSGVPWHVVSVPSGAWASCEPCGFVPPLVGREFVHGVVDCYSMIRDWYRLHRGVEIPDFARTWEWWDRGESLYESNFATAGFVECGDLHEGAVLLMQIGRSPVPNHAAIWMPDDTVLHHLHNRLSSRDPWDGYLRRATRRILRYAGTRAA